MEYNDKMAPPPYPNPNYPYPQGQQIGGYPPQQQGGYPPQQGYYPQPSNIELNSQLKLENSKMKNFRSAAGYCSIAAAHDRGRRHRKLPQLPQWPLGR